jgi:hypothetical protein
MFWCEEKRRQCELGEKRKERGVFRNQLLEIKTQNGPKSMR